MRNSLFTIGQNVLSGARVTLDLASLLAHWIILGGTGRGKSKLLENLLRYFLDQRVGFMLLDPGGHLYEDMLSYVFATARGKSTVCFNANDTDYSFGIDLLARFGVDSCTRADQIYAAFMKVLGQDMNATMPLTERSMRNVLIPLVECKEATMAEMLEFSSTSSPLLRESILAGTENEYVQREWDSFARMKRSERDQLMMPVHNRAAKVNVPPNIRRVLGQVNPPFHLGEAIENRHAVLVNLSPTKVSREAMKILAISKVDQIVNYAFTRSRRQCNTPFFVIIDEASEYMSNDLPFALEKLRKLGIYFIMCYQTLSQVDRIPGYVDSVLTNADVKCVFKTNRSDAEQLANELFAGRIHGDNVKDEINRTLLMPKETVREIVSVAESESESHGRVDSSGESSSDGHGIGSSSGFSIGHSEHLVPGGSLFVPDTSDSHSDTDSHSSSTSEFSTRSSGLSSSRSDVSSRTTGKSTTRTTVPFYEYESEQELSSRQYFSIEEIRERFIADVMTQPKRRAQLQVLNDKTIPILTTFVDDIRVREKDKQKVVDRSNAKYALPAREVDRMIAERRVKLIEGTVERSTENEEKHVQEGRWQ